MKLSPVMDSLAGQFAGRVKVGKVDVSENFDLAGEYNIYSVPRVMIFKGGKRPVQEFKGFVAAAELAKAVNAALGA